VFFFLVHALVDGLFDAIEHLSAERIWYSFITVLGTSTFLGTNAFSECNFELFALFSLS
jgi:hypothetical protein